MAIQGLHDLKLGDRTLVVQRATVGRNTGISDAMLGAVGFLSSGQSPFFYVDAGNPRLRILLC
jgi:splicing factor U2AF subunit